MYRDFEQWEKLKIYCMKMSSLSKNLCIDNVAFSFLHSIFRTFYIVWQYEIEGEARALTVRVEYSYIQFLPGYFLLK